MGLAEDEALKAAAVFGKRGDAFTAAVASPKLDIAAANADQVPTRWTVDFLVAFDVAIVFELLSLSTHADRAVCRPAPVRTRGPR